MIPVPYTEPVTHVLVHKTRETHSYDREQVLDLWRCLHPWIPSDDSRGYGEADWMTDDDRVVALFELLEGSQFGDMFFGSHGDGDQWSELEARDENGDAVSNQDNESEGE